MADFIEFGKKSDTHWLTGAEIKPGEAAKSAERGCLSFFMLMSLFDWISPTVATVKEAPHGLDGWTFFIPYQAAAGKGWNQRDMVKLLKSSGVEVRSSLTRLGECGISVPLDQAAWAEYILTKNGVPIHPRSAGAPRVRDKSDGVSD